jgi:hypothetical protein
LLLGKNLAVSSKWDEIWWYCKDGGQTSDLKGIEATKFLKLDD